jgi:hypothetical protein
MCTTHLSVGYLLCWQRPFLSCTRLLPLTGQEELADLSNTLDQNVRWITCTTIKDNFAYFFGYEPFTKLKENFFPWVKWSDPPYIILIQSVQQVHECQCRRVSVCYASYRSQIWLLFNSPFLSFFRKENKPACSLLPVYTRKPLYTPVYPYTPINTRKHPYTPKYTLIHPYTPVYT